MNSINNSIFIKSLAIFLLLKMVFFNCSAIHAKATFSVLPITPSGNQILINDFKKDTGTIKGQNDYQNDSVYIKIKHNAEKNYFTRKLYGIFFRKQNIDAASRVHSKANAIDKFVAFTGKKIIRIDLIGLNAFGQSVFDSTVNQISWLENSANKLHVKTANFLIRNNLLFNEGDILNPVDFAETEQLLRSKDFIEDANIIVENADDTSSVNILVITKDAWSIGVDYRYSNPHSSLLQVYDKNLGGLGLYLSTNFYYDSRKSNLFGRKYEVGVFNIGGTFIDGNIWERRGQGYNSYAFGVNRDFFASKTKYGGGASFINSCEPYGFKTIDYSQPVCFKSYDYWIGRSFRVSRKDIQKPPHNLMFAFRYMSKYHSERPNVYIDTNTFFHNKEYFLVALSLTRQELFRANLIYSLGSTEDIPTGFRVHITAGIEKGEFARRYYIGNELSAAELTPWGYLFSSARFGGYISSVNQIQQVTANLRSTYFSNLFSFRNIEFRQFIKIDYTRGISRFYGEGESIFLDENNGIRGLSSREMSGTTRLVINLETVAFSPLYIYGFRFAFFGFADYGVIGLSSDYVIGNQSFTGFGLGVRIRNENLVLNAISIRLGYYPRIPSNAEVAYWLITGQQRTRFENFRHKEPQIMPFD